MKRISDFKTSEIIVNRSENTIGTRSKVFSTNTLMRSSAIASARNVQKNIILIWAFMMNDQS